MGQIWLAGSSRIPIINALEQAATHLAKEQKEDVVVKGLAAFFGDIATRVPEDDRCVSLPLQFLSLSLLSR